MAVRLGLGVALSLIAFVGTAHAMDMGRQNELSGEGEQKIVVDLRGVMKATAIYRICLLKDSPGSPLILSLFEQRTRTGKPRVVTRQRLMKRDGDACLDLGVRQDRYIEASSLKNEAGSVTYSYKLIAAF